MNPRAGCFLRMLVPVDGSDSSRKAAAYAVQLAACEGSELIVVHAVDEEIAGELARFADSPVEAVLERMRRGGEGYVEDVLRQARGAGVCARGEVREGIPHQVIVAMASESGADLIIMGKVGRKGPRRVLIGSVTERVIEQAPLPVLVLK